jgi:hypothetical protein
MRIIGCDLSRAPGICQRSSGAQFLSALQRSHPYLELEKTVQKKLE